MEGVLSLLTPCLMAPTPMQGMWLRYVFACLSVCLPIYSASCFLVLTHTRISYNTQEVYDKVGPDLPPPYYAVAFALVLLLVSGIQQLSLGNVFDEEEKSVSSSGAVARRRAMRDRSFFKKK